MVIKDLYDLMEKKNDDYTHWSFTIYVDGISHNILAYANAYYDIDGTNKNELNNLYNVKDLFNHEIVSFHPSYDGISVKIDKFPDMQYTELEAYIDENGKEKYRDVVKVWKD